MPTFEVTSPDGRTFRIEAPEGATREQAVARVRQMVGQQSPPPEPEAGSLEMIRAMARGTAPPGRPASEAPAPVTLPFGLGQFSVGGPAGSAVSAASSIPPSTSIPLALSTMGSLAVPPVGAARAAAMIPRATSMLGRAVRAPARMGVRASPQVGAAGAGGAVGGAGVEARDPNATPESIARAAAETGTAMGGAEALGFGVGRLASRAIAPGIRAADPTARWRQGLREFAARVPEHARAAVRRVEELLPQQGAAAGAREAMNAARASTEEATQIFRRLVQRDTQDFTPPSARKTAEQVARALGADRAKRFGFETSTGPRRFISDVFRSGDKDAIDALKRELGKGRFQDALMLNLSDVLERGVTKLPGGRRVWDGDRLQEAWEALPERTRNLYSGSTRRTFESMATFGSALTQLGRFAASPAGGSVAVPAMMAFAPGAGIPIFLARAMMNPGLTQRYLANEKLPNDVVQAIASQSFKTRERQGLLNEVNQ